MFELDDIVEIINRGDGWDGVQCRIVNTFQPGSDYVDLQVTEDSPVNPPSYGRGVFIGMWRKTSIQYPITQPTAETWAID